MYANFFLIGCPCGDRPGIYRHAKKKKKKNEPLSQDFFFLFGPKSQCVYIRTVSSYLFLFIGTFVSFLAGLRQKSKCTVHVALPKQPIN